MRTYKEALEIAKNYYPDNLFLDTIFPELSESKDERIRKELMNFVDKVKDIAKSGRDSWAVRKEDIEMCERFLVYLEKQKENPKFADSIPSDCVSNAKCEDRWHKVCDSLPDNGREVLAKDKLGNTLLARYDGEGWDVSVYDDEDYRCNNDISKWCEIPSEKQKEQKPISFNEPYNQDDYEVVMEGNATGLRRKEQKPAEMDNEEIELSDFESELFSAFSDGWQQYLLGEEVDVAQWAKEHSAQLLNAAQQELKSAEWGEEDEEMRKRAICACNFTIKRCMRDDSHYQAACDWLKSLPVGFITNPNYNEGMVELIINELKQIEVYNDCPGQYSHEISWLKSLRPQPHTVSIKNANKFAELEYERGVKDGIESEKSRHWKPTEEQMKKLRTAINLYDGDFGGAAVKPLMDLYEELKKL